MMKEVHGRHFIIAPKELKIGAALRKAREERKLTREELSSLIGTTKNTIYNWETDRNCPDLRTLPLLCSVLGLDLGDLLGCETSELTEGERGVVDCYRSLNDENREMFSFFGANLLESQRKKRYAYLEHHSLFAGKYDSSLAAGTGYDFADTRPRPAMLIIGDRDIEADAIARVKGDSMEPSYFEDEWVYFRYASSGKPGDDVVCSTTNGFIIKRLDDDGDLYSVNPDRPFTLDCESYNVRIIGVVAGKVHDEDWPDSTDQQLLESIYKKEIKEFRRAYCLADWE